MRFFLPILFIFALFIFAFSCKHVKNQTETQSKSQKSENAALNLDTTNYTSVKSDIYTLYVKDKNNKLPIQDAIEFFVLKNETGELVYGPEKLRAQISWYDSEQLIVREMVGVIEDITEDVNKPNKTNPHVYYIHIPSLSKQYKPIYKF